MFLPPAGPFYAGMGAYAADGFRAVVELDNSTSDSCSRKDFFRMCLKLFEDVLLICLEDFSLNPVPPM